MKMPVSEILDRLSICILKQTRLKKELNEEMKLTDEIELYKAELNLYPNVVEYLEKFIEINGKIWDLEAAIRIGKEGELGLEEVGRRAIKIRDFNNIRVKYKNEVVKKTNEGFEDIKGACNDNFMYRNE